MDTFSLISAPWLPVRRRSGVRSRVAPAELTDGVDGDAIVALDWPRADFNAAGLEFLIGLMSVAFRDQAAWSPEQGDALWKEWWHAPPDAGALAAGLDPLASSFAMTGDGPLFGQDFEALASEPVPVAGLLIEAPGQQTLRENADLFVRRGGAQVLGLSTAAIAVFTLQAYAPSGGRGNMTSLRGGGPLTTVMLPPTDGALEPSLWHQIWLNVVWNSDWPAVASPGAEIFPWLGPARVSDKKRKTTPADVHPAQCFWGQPRRIRLIVEANDAAVPCAVTGQVEPSIIRMMRTRPYGADYDAWHRAHPLSPYYRLKTGSPEWLPLHPQSGSIGFTDMLALVHGDVGEPDQALRMPAAVRRLAADRLRLVGIRSRGVRLRAFGYDMDNMKARGFLDATLPVLMVADAVKSQLADLDRRLISAARMTADALVRAVSNAVHGDRGPGSDKGMLLDLRAGFLRTLDREHEAIQEKVADGVARLPDNPVPEDFDPLSLEARTAWLSALRRVAEAHFTRATPWHTPEALHVAALARLVNQWALLRGFVRSGKKLHQTLGLQPPARAKKQGTASTAAVETQS